MNNSRFATNLHILTLLSSFPGEWLNSDFIAGSIAIHPVLIRKELILLNEAGFILTKKGKEGGAMLNIKPDEISLKAVFLLVKHSDVLGKKIQMPNPSCPIGRQINDQLTHLYNEMDLLVLKELDKKTLKNFVEGFQ